MNQCHRCWEHLLSTPAPRAMPLMDTNYKISAPQGDIAQELPCCPGWWGGVYDLVSVCLSVSRELWASGIGLSIGCDPVSLVWQLGYWILHFLCDRPKPKVMYKHKHSLLTSHHGASLLLYQIPQRNWKATNESVNKINASVWVYVLRQLISAFNLLLCISQAENSLPGCSWKTEGAFEPLVKLPTP